MAATFQSKGVCPEIHPSKVTCMMRDRSQSGKVTDCVDDDDESVDDEDDGESLLENGEDSGDLSHSGDVCMGWYSTVS